MVVGGVNTGLPDGYRTGGVAVGARKSSAPAVVTGTSSARLSVTGSVITVLEEPLTEAECLYPSELLPFTRKNLFLIVESDNASAFAVRTQVSARHCEPQEIDSPRTCEWGMGCTLHRVAFAQLVRQSSVEHLGSSLASSFRSRYEWHTHACTYAGAHH